MDIRMLGPLEAERDGALLKLGGRKQRSILAALVLRPREAISADRLVDLVWEGSPPASAASTLRGYLSNLRRALGTEDHRPLLVRTDNGYLLDVPDEVIDAKRFEVLVEAGRLRRDAADLHGAVATWTSALGLWRGDALQDFAYSDFAQAPAVRLTELRSTCTEDLFEAELALGRHDRIAGDLDGFCAEYPTRERALRLRMLALYRSGRQADALEAYEQGRKRLAADLGVDPSPELRELHEQIVRQDERLTAPAPRETAAGKHTLTFVLGDVESSTESLRRLGDRYADVLDEHRRILKAAFDERGGHAVHTWGDEVFAAFETASAAVRGAVAAQLRLTRLDGERSLPVRLGVHTGEAGFTGGEYVGLAVNIAARVMDAAHGGQILVSQATRELIETGDAELIDAGRHRLKDVRDDVHLFQVVHPGLRRDFPPLRTRTVPSGNLPVRITSFVGRQDDLDDIEATLDEARLLTLTGVGGVGKTRLAVEAGRRLAQRYRDGVWLCELAALDDAEGLIRSLCNTLAIEQERGRSLRESVVAALGQRESLVILDNCEHLVEPVAELVEDIVHAAPVPHIIATSREALGVEGERWRPVRPLTVSADDPTAVTDAMRLFEDRARERRSGFTIDTNNASDVAGICARLDGIPLAIELAAASVTSMTTSEIAARLEEGFDFLRSGRRTAVDRHRTLDATIGLSYGLLSEPERMLFDRVSVFGGGFTLEAAREICGPGLDLDLADGLASLVTKSMVDADVAGDQARYILLDTMRRYGRDRLAERGEADDIRRAHDRYFMRLVLGFRT